MLAYNEAPVKEIPFDPDKDLTPELLEMCFVCMSEEQQDNFLSNLKEKLDERDYRVIVTHLKAYDMAMMSDNREKEHRIKEEMGTALYESLKTK